MSEETGTTRRAVIGGAAAMGAGALLAACSGRAGEAPPATDGPSSELPAGDNNGTAIAKASDVPEGSGTISADGKVVISQPTPGQFKGFSSICTHKGCAVSKIEGDTITCPCHGSQFSTADGSVKHGPAAAPLTAVKIVQKGGELFIG